MITGDLNWTLPQGVRGGQVRVRKIKETERRPAPVFNANRNSQRTEINLEKDMGRGNLASYLCARCYSSLYFCLSTASFHWVDSMNGRLIMPTHRAARR